jgi:iron(III) transport system ATP-binding protein
MVAIDIHNLCKIFPSPSGTGTTAAVNSVSLQIPSGHLFFLLGPSGCGKTTLLRMIAGFTLPTSGKILFDGIDISQVPPHRRDTGMVFQSYALWPHMNVSENVAFGLDVRKIKAPERDHRITEALTLVQMDHLKDRRPNQLSGGQQQRVALARALAIRPKCLLLDEPLSNLDAKLRLEMRAEIRRIVKQSGITAIYVTHDQKEALSMADGIAVLRQGHLIQAGSPTDLYQHPTTRFVAGFIGESNFLAGTIDTITTGTLVIKTPAGPLMALPPKGHSLSKGATVSLAIRPEAIQLADPYAPPAGVSVNRLRGKRISSTYLGDMAEHWIALPGAEQPLKSFELNPSPNRRGIPGAEVILQIPAQHVMIVSND